MGKFYPQPEMDVEPPPSSQKSDAEKPQRRDQDRQSALPQDDQQDSQRNDESQNLDLDYLDVQEMDGVVVFYNLKTGALAVYDPATGRTEAGYFKTNTDGGEQNRPIPAGDYAILEQAREDSVRLERMDNQFGDDQVGTTGQTLLRMHGPGRSIGCVTALDRSAWEKVKDLITGQPDGLREVQSKSRLSEARRTEDSAINDAVRGSPFLESVRNAVFSRPATERLPFYGTLHVF